MVVVFSFSLFIKRDKLKLESFYTPNVFNDQTGVNSVSEPLLADF